MKLRNKKTGGIVDFLTIDLTGEGEIEFCFIAPDGDERGWEYNSLAEFNEEWEDYKPAEPLIKDKKIRKAVRAWAEANELSDKIRVINEHFDTCKFIGRWNNGNVCLDIEFKTTIAHADKDQFYTIVELCGEEEE